MVLNIEHQQSRYAGRFICCSRLTESATREINIHARTGDTGQTSLLDPARARRFLGIETYRHHGDELNSHICMLRDLLDAYTQSSSRTIQVRLFDIGSHLRRRVEATVENSKVPMMRSRRGSAGGRPWTPLMRTFPRYAQLHPSRRSPGHLAVHICRMVCRRAVVLAIRLEDIEAVPAITIRYLNRLSDLLFSSPELDGHRLNVPETPWKPRG
ncbi:MAG: ATP:cob(I)alamin adenosyltransferase [Flavobacteriales bacterium]|nr:ATP:cob(I)alamin adenosyltransferase [Flavobacteriales bacterium]